MITTVWILSRWKSSSVSAPIRRQTAEDSETIDAFKISFFVWFSLFEYSQVLNIGFDMQYSQPVFVSGIQSCVAVVLLNVQLHRG